MYFPKKLHKKLQERKENNSFRVLPAPKEIVDFSSNDYLGFGKSKTIFENTHQFLVENQLEENGSTGSRLLSGNSTLAKNLESFLADFHKVETATVFNSGYSANLGFFGTLPQRGDIILYDELIHASIRDGMQLSNAKAYKFKHNDLEDLEKKILKQEKLRQVQFDSKIQTKQNENVSQAEPVEVYVVTESVFSMDGDSPDLAAMAEICKKYNAFFVVDEAHAVGVFGGGLVQKKQLQEAVFARIVTFGKAMGCHGAVILGSTELKEYLVNFARSFIYTTALSPHSLATIRFAYDELLKVSSNAELDLASHLNFPQKKLRSVIQYFLSEVKRIGFPVFPSGEMSERQWGFIVSNSAIHCCVISGNQNVKEISQQLQQKGFDVKAVLSPTVPKGKERLRFCLHSYNSKEEITQVLDLLSSLTKM